jgi:hypothetical protein
VVPVSVAFLAVLLVSTFRAVLFELAFLVPRSSCRPPVVVEDPCGVRAAEARFAVGRLFKFNPFTINT